MKWYAFTDMQPSVGEIILCYRNDGSRELVVSGDSTFQQDGKPLPTYSRLSHPWLYWCQPGYPMNQDAIHAILNKLDLIDCRLRILEAHFAGNNDAALLLLTEQLRTSEKALLTAVAGQSQPSKPATGAK